MHTTHSHTLPHTTGGKGTRQYFNTWMEGWGKKPHQTQTCFPPPPAIKSNLLIVLPSSMVFSSEKKTHNHFVGLIIIFYQLVLYFVITWMGYAAKQSPFVRSVGEWVREEGGSGSRSARLIPQEEKKGKGFNLPCMCAFVALRRVSPPSSAV